MNTEPQSPRSSRHSRHGSNRRHSESVRSGASSRRASVTKSTIPSNSTVLSNTPTYGNTSPLNQYASPPQGNAPSTNTEINNPENFDKNPTLKINKAIETLQSNMKEERYALKKSLNTWFDNQKARVDDNMNARLHGLMDLMEGQIATATANTDVRIDLVNQQMEFMIARMKEDSLAIKEDRLAIAKQLVDLGNMFKSTQAHTVEHRDPTPHEIKTKRESLDNTGHLQRLQGTKASVHDITELEEEEFEAVANNAGKISRDNSLGLSVSPESHGPRKSWKNEMNENAAINVRFQSRPSPPHTSGNSSSMGESIEAELRERLRMMHLSEHDLKSADNYFAAIAQNIKHEYGGNRQFGEAMDEWKKRLQTEQLLNDLLKTDMAQGRITDVRFKQGNHNGNITKNPNRANERDDDPRHRQQQQQGQDPPDDPDNSDDSNESNDKPPKKGINRDDWNKDTKKLANDLRARASLGPQSKSYQRHQTPSGELESRIGNGIIAGMEKIEYIINVLMNAPPQSKQAADFAKKSKLSPPRKLEGKCTHAQFEDWLTVLCEWIESNGGSGHDTSVDSAQ